MSRAPAKLAVTNMPAAQGRGGVLGAGVARWVGGRSAVRVTDVRLDAMLAARYYGRLTGMTIEFFPSGMSRGGVIALAHLGVGYEVCVNWLTGGVDVAPHRPL